MYTAVLTLLAEQEHNDILAWYAQDDVLKVTRWLDDFDQLLDRLEDNPYQYAEHLLFIRRARFHKFYHAFYAIDEVNKVVEIIGIQHSSRDSAIIRRRINFD